MKRNDVHALFCMRAYSNTTWRWISNGDPAKLSKKDRGGIGMGGGIRLALPLKSNAPCSFCGVCAVPVNRAFSST